MHSSNPYTFAPVKTKKAGAWASVILGVAAATSGVIWGILPNGGIEALFPANTASHSSTTTSTGPKTATGDAIDYQFGTVQVSVTSENGKITSVDMVQAGANGGREQAFPILQQAAVDSNGTNFGNVSGATFTTDAFKRSLDSAIAKL